MLRWKSSLKPAASGDDNPGTTNLVNDWSMDETSGTRADSHGSADLTDNNTVTSATGVISNAASFNPANSEYLSSSTQPVTGTVARATECWFKTSYSGTDSQCITDYGAGATGERWRIGIDDGGLVALRVFGATKIWDSSWNDGNWHHLVMQVAASSECDDVEVYVDGTLDTSAAGASATVSIDTGTGSQRIGIRSNTTKGFNGQIDEFRNWNRVLTSAEITWLYNSGNGRSYSDVSGGGGGDNPGTTNLVAWLGMDEGSGVSVDDSTSNNNDFTLTNGTWVGSGKVGSNAVRLDGSGDYISSDSALTIGSKICTVSFWMDWTKVGSGEKYLYELGNRWWQTDGSITLKWDQSNTRFLAAMQDSTSGTKYLEVAFPEPSDGQWVYVTVVYNGTANSNAGEIKLYYDGVEQSSSSTPTNTKDQASDFTSSTLYIGANSNGGEEITVDLDTFAIFSDELTSSEITWLYNSGSGKSYSDVSGGGASLASDVLLYVPFTDADGSTTADGYVLSGGTHPLTSDVFTRSGNAVINTDQTKMTGSSTAAYNPAVANSDGWELDSTISAGLEVGSSSPLSIQFWFYCSNDGSGSSARLLGWDGWHTSGSGIEFETLSTDYDRFIFYEHTGATTSRRSIGDHVLNANAWNHIYWAFQPSGSSYLGINGTVTEASGSYITNFAPTVDLNLLKTPANADDAVKGYVQEFIVKNTVPYTANFTPSTTPLV